MTITDYRNFDLLITRAGDRYKAFVVDAPAGEASAAFDRPFTADELAGLGGPARGVRRGMDAADGPAAAASLIDLGSRLFTAIFRDKVGAVLAASLASAAQEGAGLRLRLRFEEDAADLALLPWETLYDPDQRRFVSLGEGSPILRYLALPRSRSALVVEPPLRVLAVLAGPTGLAPLDVEREWQAIQDALAGLAGDGKFVLERLASPTLDALQQRLLGEPVHILHFVGHGAFDGTAGSLVLEDAAGRPRPVRGEALAKLLRNHPAVRLAYLNACEGALASGQSVFTGVAQALVQGGAPAAVAMQAEISDAGAVVLARTFYSAVAAGRPVDAALTQARAALSAAGSPEWAIPVLFSRSPDNRLFDIRRVLPTPDCPYPGMAAFTEAQQALFFGRDREIEEAVERLRQHPFLAVIGPSGSGKSSLVYAGVIPALRRSRRFGPDQWQIKVVRPGAKPLAALDAALGAASDTPAGFPPDGGRTLLFVDQFEETFTLAEAGEVGAFLDALHGLVGRPDLHILLTVRADFYPDLMACSLWQPIRANRLELPPLGDDALWAAIVEPAGRVGVTVDEALAVKLIADAAGERGALPLVQETLVLLWDRVEGRQLRLKAYQGMAEGGRSGLQVAIDRRASLIYDNLPAEAQPIARRIFLRLVQFGEGRADTRRQQTAAELRASGDDPALFDRTLARLTESRLLTASGDAEGGGRRVDIAHEALIAGWPRLQAWTDQRRAAEQTRRRLEAKAAEWVRAEKRGGLLDEYELQEAGHWLAAEDARELGYSQELTDLVAASKTALAQAEAEKLAQQQRELAQAQKLAEAQRLRAEEKEKAASGLRRRLIAATVLGGIALLAFLAAAWFGADANRQKGNAETALATATVAQGQAKVEAENAVAAQATAEAETLRADEKAREAERQAAIARARQLAAQSSKELADNRYELAVVLAVEAGHATGILGNGILEAFDAIRTAISRPGRTIKVLYGHTEDVTQAMWSQDESRVLTVGDDLTARIWDAVSGVELVNLEGVFKAVWSPDESKVLTSDLDAIVRIWDAATGAELIKRMDQDVWAMTWSREGARILARSFDTVSIWDAGTGADLVELTGHEGHITQATWNRDESQVLTASEDNTVRIWDAVTGAERTKLVGHEGYVWQALWSRDETKVLTASQDGTARIWDAAIARELVVLKGHQGPVTQATWSQDEAKVLTTSADGTARIWDAASGSELIKLDGHTFTVSQATWSQDGSKILTTSQDATVHIWDAVNGVELAKLEGHKGIVRQAMWSRDGTRILTSGDEDTVRIWDASTGVELITLGGHTDFVSQATWNRDESKVLTAGTDHTARIWDIAPGTELIELKSGESGIRQASWSTDESKVLTVGEDAAVRIVDTATGAELVKWVGFTNFPFPPTWNQDESKVLTEGDDASVHIMDVATGDRLATLRGHRNFISQATWSQDGSKVLTASADGTARIWDAVSGAELVRLEHRTGAISQATWSQDGSKVLTASADNTARIWDAANGAELVRLEGHTNTVRQATWSRDGSKVLTASFDGTARIWDATSGAGVVKLAGHTDYVQQAMWSKDETQVVTASNDDTARIWDATSGVELIRLEGHLDTVLQATWSQDGSKVLTVGIDGTARIWNAISGAELARLGDGIGVITQAVWSQDGSKVLTASRDGAIHIRYVYMADLVAAICQRVPRNFTWDEWNRLVKGDYRPTCKEAPIPPDVIEAIQGQVRNHVLAGDMDAATTILAQLNDSLADSGQFKSYGVDPAAFIAEVQSEGSD